MSHMPGVLLLSAGRRNYLLLELAKAFPHRTVAADASWYAPTRACGVPFVTMPPFHDSAYLPALIGALHDYDIDAIISLNDYESTVLAEHANSLRAERPGIVIHPDPSVAWLGIDKHRAAQVLAAAGACVPHEELMDPDRSAEEEAARLFDLLGERVVLKRRTGSASAGIAFACGIDELIHALNQRSGEQGWLAQSFVSGVEFGADIVNDLDGNYLGSLLREKREMRWGETQVAITRAVAASTREFLHGVSTSFRHSFTADVDFVVDHDGQNWLIDFNPRFGGGYPISQATGASLGMCFLGLLRGDSKVSVLPHLEYEANIVVAKTIDVVQLPDI